MILEQITQQLTETLTARVLTLFGHAVDRVILQAPPKLNMGDLATPVALELAKALKRKPREIAETIANGLSLIGSSAATQYIITGLILLAAVTLDTISRHRLEAAGR